MNDIHYVINDIFKFNLDPYLNPGNQIKRKKTSHNITFDLISNLQ